MPRAALIALAGALLAAFAAFAAACTPAEVAEVQTYAGVNAIRAEYGLPPLAADAELVHVARERSADMAQNHYFSHFPPDGCNYACLIDRDRGFHEYAGENLAWNNAGWDDTAAIAVQMWRDSPPHLANILNCHYQRFGTGAVRADDGVIYYTMVFEGDAAC
ncbi:MAG TPA: CAP domain-containing protein [Dehalococcoidia bacterium]|nr:CAP domain-containing protein [Dehalococcoidia bacterium]